MNSKLLLPLVAFLILLDIPGRAHAQTGEDEPRKQGETTLTSEDSRKIADRIRKDLRLIDAAVDQWAIENNKPAGTPVPIKELAQYFKPGSQLQKAATAGQFLDALGNPITVVAVDTLPALSQKTFDQLSEVAPAEFWKPYPVK